MLPSQDINKLSAQKNVSDVIVEKDYILDWVLWGIAQNSDMLRILGNPVRVLVHAGQRSC